MNQHHLLLLLVVVAVDVEALLGHSRMQARVLRPQGLISRLTVPGLRVSGLNQSGQLLLLLAAVVMAAAGRGRGGKPGMIMVAAAANAGAGAP